MLILLHPRFHAVKNRLTRLKKGDGLKTAVLALLGVAFWAFMFVVSYRVLSYFRTVEGLGDLLALRLLSMVLLTFFSILVFSNVVTSLSTFYLSGELDILHSSPIRIESIYRAKFIETMIDSSWMTLIYGLPVFIAYGVVFKAGAAYFAGLLLTIVPFLIIPAAIGIIVTMLLVSAFPARRARDILVLLGLLIFVVLYILFRMLRPESLVDPDAFPTLVQYLTAMRGPVSPLLPSSWASDALAPLLRKNARRRPLLPAHALEHGPRRHRHRRVGLRQDLLRRLVPVAGRQKGEDIPLAGGGPVLPPCRPAFPRHDAGDRAEGH